MNEKTLTLDEAKAEIQTLLDSLWDGYPTEYDNIRGCGVDDALAILARVHVPEPDEEGQDVLWLIREKKWAISREHGQWVRITFTSDGFFDFHTINPVEEAKKLGWGGGE